MGFSLANRGTLLNIIMYNIWAFFCQNMHYTLIPEIVLQISGQELKGILPNYQDHFDKKSWSI